MVFMKIEFLGADREVTGSCHYVAFGETHFLVDCGMGTGGGSVCESGDTG